MFGAWFSLASNSPCQEVGFICPFVVIDSTDLGATTVGAEGLVMLDNFLPLPHAESLPFYTSVKKLVVCVWPTTFSQLLDLNALFAAFLL